MLIDSWRVFIINGVSVAISLECTHLGGSTEGPLDAVMGTGGFVRLPMGKSMNIHQLQLFADSFPVHVSTMHIAVPYLRVFLLKEPAYIQLYTMIYHDRIWYDMMWYDMICHIYIFKLHYISITIHSMYTSRTPMAHPVSSSPWPRAKKPPAQWSAARTKSTFEVRWRKTYPLVNKHRPWKSPIFNGN